MFLDVKDHLGEVKMPLAARSGALTRVCPRELLFGNVVGTKVVRDDENRFLKLVPDVHNHLGDILVPRTARSRVLTPSLRWLDLTQMVMDIWKLLKATTLIFPNNFCFNNIAKKSFPGTPLDQVPDLAVRGRWSSPRWSWTFSSCPGLISGPRAFP